MLKLLLMTYRYAAPRATPCTWWMGVWRQCDGRLALTALLGCFALLATVPATAAADATVTGKVTNGKGEGLENVEVRYYSSEHEYGRYVTEKNGEYGKDINAESGEFKVEFVPPSGSKYASQYYDGKSSYATATTVIVEANKTTSVSAVLTEGSTIHGRVTSAASEAEVAEAEITVDEAKTPNAVVVTADSNEFGNYEVSGLSKGEYVVGFKAIPKDGQNFAPQFYNESARFSEATVLDLHEHEEREINASLLKGGSISGTVTDAVTHLPLTGIIVYAALGGEEDPIAAAATGANGQYTLAGMPSESVVVVFVLQSKEDQALYTSQLYDNVSLPESISGFGELGLFGTPVNVIAGSETTEINAAMVRKEPASTLAPVVSGTPAVGQTLSCANGSWTGIAPLSYAEQWLRSGSAIAGATGSTYVIQAADEGHGLACEVTATNEFGKVSATSNTLTVALPSAPSAATTAVTPAAAAAAPVVVISSSKIVASSGAARVPIACKNGNCSGTIELTEQVAVKHRHGKKTTSKKETLVLAEGSYSLAAGHSATVVVQLTAKGRSALATARHHQLSARVLAEVSGGKPVQKSILLSELAAKRKASHR